MTSYLERGGHLNRYLPTRWDLWGIRIWPDTRFFETIKKKLWVSITSSKTYLEKITNGMFQTKTISENYCTQERLSKCKFYVNNVKHFMFVKWGSNEINFQTRISLMVQHRLLVHGSVVRHPNVYSLPKHGWIDSEVGIIHLSKWKVFHATRNFAM